MNMIMGFQIYASNINSPNGAIIPYYLYAEDCTEARKKFYARYPNMRIEYME